MRIGLVANRLHRQSADGALAGWARSCEAGIRQLGLGLHAVGGTYDALRSQDLLSGYEPLVRLPSGVEGGVMRLASCIAGGLTPADELDGVIYLLDPVDPSSLYPETQALKRQCVIHGKPFISTAAGAAEWIAVELVHAGQDGASLSRSFEGQTVALIAHDALKPRMIEFAAKYFDVLSRFAIRVGTGTTGGLLNDMAWSRGWPADKPWITRYMSGPMGGDAQIAELVLDRRCNKAIFFEDPHVARQHEADIQLLERAVCAATHDTTCFNSPAMAERWAEAVSRG
ncbi:methylglyoxal synthase [Variovorax sp. J22R133]|uniref:methylglyoxal synthase n=1 Tax=Variovorax brevis TaxID=3053503 RepID=UPI002578C81B|nr:methylglyoxal synthase [Variovorax sp. J22R133]MDM0110632.1 methylglyoxal synthase [Variovorax sp. J22R133]